MLVCCPCHIAVLGYSRSLDAQCVEEYCNVNVSAFNTQKKYPKGVRSEKFPTLTVLHIAAASATAN